MAWLFVALVFATAAAAGEVRTPVLGIEFWQYDKPIELRLLKKTASGRAEASVELERGPFEVRLPERHWPTPEAEYPAIQLAISDTPDLFAIPRIGAPINETAVFASGSGMAGHRYSASPLLTAHGSRGYDAHNYIVGGRSDKDGPDYRGFAVQKILHRTTKSNIMNESNYVYMIFYVATAKIVNYKKTQTHPILASDLEFVTIHFSN